MIRLAGVTVAVPVLRADGSEHTKTLLRDIDLTLTEPRIALIGANGSGKSTLLRLLNGLLTPSAGQVLVDGLDTHTKARQVRQRVGFVFTDPLSQLVMSTPLEDVELSLRRTFKDRRERRARAQHLLDERGLGHLAHQSIYDLSGGERQLVALTAVLAIEPQVVVADEPTTLLDLRNRERMRRAFAALPQQVIYSTHDLDVAADAQRVLVIDDGRVVFDGAPAAAIDHYRGRMT
ncbi:energy-coupling factor ABC transporter ATP-binding protein [Enemella sp. A6]|uniref:energy-coupling factor ABC transporter ATP-binding protein n=1 Tax=Enemella sp. A6 TaxID=3440152 RepID=UPI003EC0B917